MRIELVNVTKTFNTVVAVNNVSLSIDSGQLISLLGPSGCGKTTILNLISGILPVTSGRILFNGQDVTNVSPDKRGIGLVFQNYALYPHMTVLDNISFPLMVKKIPKKERIEAAKQFAELVQVQNLLNRKPGQLSGGQQQRVAIARALSKKPGILLLDEPLSNLDARLRLEMREEIRRVQKETNITTIFVTHDQEESASISDKIALLKEGEIQQYASPRDLYDEPANLFTAGFIGVPSINQLQGFYTDGVFRCENEEIKLPDTVKALLNRSQLKQRAQLKQRGLVLAFRAESVLIAKSQEVAHFTANVEEVYTAGKDNLALMTLGKTRFRVFVADDVNLEPNKKAHLYFKNKGLFLFDAETGERYS